MLMFHLVLFVEHSSTSRRQRKASPDTETTRKNTRSSEPEPCNTSSEEVRVTAGKGPTNKKKKRKRGFDLSDEGNEASTSSSVDTGTGRLILSNIITQFRNMRFWFSGFIIIENTNYFSVHKCVFLIFRELQSSRRQQ